MCSSHDVADYFLSLADDEAGDLISNLKLQKLLYYSQGFYLAMFKKPLFEESIESWMHGPVVPEIYHKYKEYGKEAIPEPDTINHESYSEEEKEFLDEIYSVYGQFSAWKLRNMTHEESPWRNTQKGKEISHDSLLNYFSTQID